MQLMNHTFFVQKMRGTFPSGGGRFPQRGSRPGIADVTGLVVDVERGGVGDSVEPAWIGVGDGAEAGMGAVLGLVAGPLVAAVLGPAVGPSPVAEVQDSASGPVDGGTGAVGPFC